MKEKINQKPSAWSFLWMALYAFLGLGMEIVVIVIEQGIFGITGEYTSGQKIMHWVMTCVIWGIFAFMLYRTAKRRYGFDALQKQTAINGKLLIVAIVLVIAGIAEATVSWKGFKPYMEAQNKTVAEFIMQYIYYFFETVLYILIVIFGQKFGEERFGHGKIPYGGIVLALTWGMVHIWTQGIATGIEAFLFSLVFGVIYLCVGKNTKLTYLFCACIFIL